MANCAFGWPIYSDASTTYTPTFSGGTWDATLTLANLADRRLALVARSSAATYASTQFDVDLKTARQVGLIAIPKHTISTAGSARFRGTNKTPIFDSLTVGDSAWTAIGTPTRTAAAATASDGSPLDLVGDDTAAAAEGYYKAVTFTGDTTKVFAFRYKQGSSTQSIVEVYDNTASAAIGQASITWSGGVPTVTPVVGSVIANVSLGGGLYRCVMWTTTATAAHTNRVRVFPATTNAYSVNPTGDLYGGDVVAWDQTSLFYSATVGDGAWSNSAPAPTRTAGSFTCADGVTLDLINDTSAVAQEYTFKNLSGTPFTSDGTKTIQFRCARSSAFNAVYVALYDTSTGANVIQLNIDYTNATPVVTAVVGTLVSANARGDGSYDIVATGTVVAAHSHSYVFAPSGIPLANIAACYFGAATVWDSAADPQVYDSGTIAVWPIVYPAGSLPSTDTRLVANGGTGKYTAEEALYVNIGFTHVPSSLQNARYWRCNITDTTNAAGYVDLARLCICGLIQPTVNMADGSTFQLTSESQRWVTDGGAAVYLDKARRRNQVFTVHNLTEDEMLAGFYEMQQRVGATGQVMWCHDTADTSHRTRRSFLAVLRELNALEYPYGTRMNVPFAVVEEL